MRVRVGGSGVGMDLPFELDVYLMLALVTYLAPWRGWGRAVALGLHALHRLWASFFTLGEVGKWRSGAATHTLKDWLQEDFAYIAFFPFLFLQACVGGALLWRAWRRGSLAWPRFRAVVPWLVPDLVLLVTLFLFGAAAGGGG